MKTVEFRRDYGVDNTRFFQLLKCFNAELYYKPLEKKYDCNESLIKITELGTTIRKEFEFNGQRYLFDALTRFEDVADEDLKRDVIRVVEQDVKVDESSLIQINFMANDEFKDIYLSFNPINLSSHLKKNTLGLIKTNQFFINELMDELNKMLPWLNLYLNGKLWSWIISGEISGQVTFNVKQLSFEEMLDDFMKKHDISQFRIIEEGKDVSELYKRPIANISPTFNLVNKAM